MATSTGGTCAALLAAHKGDRAAIAGEASTIEPWRVAVVEMVERYGMLSAAAKAWVDKQLTWER